MRFTVGETVGVLLHGGGRDHSKRGVVLSESKGGACVRVDGESVWVTSNRVRRIAPDGSLVKATHRKAGELAASRLPGRIGELSPDLARSLATPSPAPGPALAPVDAAKAATPAPPADADALFAQLRAAGLDPMALWDRLGSALAETARTEYTAAANALTRANDDLTAAEGLVQEMEAARTAAENALAAATDDLALAREQCGEALAASQAAEAAYARADARLARIDPNRP